VFSEAVSGVTNDDVDLSASTAGGTLIANVYPTADPLTHDVKVNGMTTAGDVIAKVKPNAASVPQGTQARRRPAPTTR
jgi:hypothetical protein